VHDVVPCLRLRPFLPCRPAGLDFSSLGYPAKILGLFAEKCRFAKELAVPSGVGTVRRPFGPTSVGMIEA
jgi:hypothetical protein